MELLSLGRMAARLRVTQGWLRERAEVREVPCLQAGKRFLFNPAAVLDALAVQAARPAGNIGAGNPVCVESMPTPPATDAMSPAAGGGQ